MIYSLNGYSKKLRKEVTKSKKWYFFDNGLRNALINDFSSLSQRNDIGQLWEQYILSERIKNNAYQGYPPQYYFWRTYDGQEIDLVESYNGMRRAFECKWKNQRVKKPVAFDKAYPEAGCDIVSQDNYLDIITQRHSQF